MRRTKIVCTIGPATESEEALRSLIKAGMNVARLNFSHGTHAQHKQVISRIRHLSKEMGVVVGILQDLSGPKLRVGKIPNLPMILVRGQKVIMTTKPLEGRENVIPFASPEALRALGTGDRIILDDGNLELRVEATGVNEVECKVIRGGPLVSNKGVNLPSLKMPFSGFTEKDRKDLQFGIREGVDWVAMSFIRRAEDLLPLRQEMMEAGKQIPIVAKIEKPQAVEHLTAIIAAADAVMVARGDLGVEMPLERVPLLQKEIIQRCTSAGKPAIVATQMLESMTHAARPTRAEVSDIANAILDGADAVMLSGETAVGEYPLLAVEVMDRVARQTEKTLDYERLLAERTSMPCATVTDAISQACGQVATDLKVAAIVTATRSGHTAAMVSRLRPRAPLLAITSDIHTYHRLALWWGVHPFLVKRTGNTDEMTEIAVRTARERGFAQPGDRIVITAGMPPGISGNTNLIKVETIPQG